MAQGRNLNDDIADMMNKLQTKYKADPQFLQLTLALKPFIDKSNGNFIARKKPLTKFDDLPTHVLGKISDKLSYKNALSLNQVRPNSNPALTHLKQRLTELVTILLTNLNEKYMCSVYCISKDGSHGCQMHFVNKTDGTVEFRKDAPDDMYYGSSWYAAWDRLDISTAPLDAFKKDLISTMYNTDIGMTEILANKRIFVGSTEIDGRREISPLFFIPANQAYISIDIQQSYIKENERSYSNSNIKSDIRNLVQTLNKLCTELYSGGLIGYSSVHEHTNVEVPLNLPWTNSPAPSGGKAIGYRRTTVKHTGKDGVIRSIYIKGKSRYVKQRCKDGTYKYMLIK